jgi:VIT1/CCC1 family predicted Fe2+/Mn2+ transporter
MTIEQAVFWYATIFCILLVPLIWLLIKRRAEKKAEKAKLAGNAENAPTQPARKPIDWSALLALRPHAVLSGEMWLKSSIAAFVALCVGVIIVVFVFPLGALWAASAAFVAVIVIVSLMFTLLD